MTTQPEYDKLLFVSYYFIPLVIWLLPFVIKANNRLRLDVRRSNPSDLLPKIFLGGAAVEFFPLGICDDFDNLAVRTISAQFVCFAGALDICI